MRNCQQSRRHDPGRRGHIISRLLEAAYWRFHPRVRRWAAELPRQRQIDEAFDRRFGVDTAAEVALTDLGMSGADAQRGHGLYRPAWTEIVQGALESLDVDFPRFTFVDYGSGKGKALLLASDHPFQEIVGVEFARPLHEVAVRNIEKYSSPTQRCRALRSVCADATDFEPPPRPLVCFFFNPFDDATMNAVLDRLRDSVRRHPREVLLVYTNARHVSEHARLFRDRDDLALVSGTDRRLVYRCREGAPPP
jgi:hypothetical protein